MEGYDSSLITQYPKYNDKEEEKEEPIFIPQETVHVPNSHLSGRKNLANIMSGNSSSSSSSRDVLEGKEHDALRNLLKNATKRQEDARKQIKKEFEQIETVEDSSSEIYNYLFMAAGVVLAGYGCYCLGYRVSDLFKSLISKDQSIEIAESDG